MSGEVIPFAQLGPIELPSLNRTVYIQNLVAASYGIDPSAMTKPMKRRSCSGPRQIAMYLVRTVDHKSLPKIGELFHRDHSTVVHAIKQVQARMAADPMYRADVEALREALN